MQTVLLCMESREIVFVYGTEKEKLCVVGKRVVCKGKREREIVCMETNGKRDRVSVCGKRRFRMHEKWRLCVRGKERDCVCLRSVCS